MSKVKVYNEETAFPKKLIVAYVPKERRDEVRESNGNMSYEMIQEWFNREN